MGDCVGGFFLNEAQFSLHEECHVGFFRYQEFFMVGTCVPFCKEQMGSQTKTSEVGLASSISMSPRSFSGQQIMTSHGVVFFNFFFFGKRLLHAFHSRYFLEKRIGG